MPLSPYSYDNFVAPEMSQFTAASVRDMTATSDEQEHWLYNFMLNSLLRANVELPVRQTLFNFLRRTQFAFREYDLAREQTAAFLRNREVVGAYFLAISHWEVFLSYTYQAYELLTRTEKRALFKPGDGSVLQRLWLLYTRSKHVGSAITNGWLASGSTLAVWLTNDGLRAVGADLTFEEMAELLEELARWSDAAQNPLTMREKMLVHYPDAAGTETETGDDRA